MEDKIIYDLLKEVRDDQKEYNGILTKQSITLDSFNKEIVQIKEDLKYHIERTDMLSDLHEDNARQIEINKNELEESIRKTQILDDLLREYKEEFSKKIETVEEPMKAREYLIKNWKMYTGMIITLLTIITMISKFMV